jgi:hypothetical protein
MDGPSRFGDTQPVAVHHHEKQMIAGPVPSFLRCLEQSINLVFVQEVLGALMPVPAAEGTQREPGRGDRKRTVTARRPSEHVNELSRDARLGLASKRLTIKTLRSSVPRPPTRRVKAQRAWRARSSPARYDAPRLDIRSRHACRLNAQPRARSMRCFVISPIGQPGSETRAHADDVFECIIEPALKKTKVEGRRADHIQDVGRITKQMYNDILSSDFCIAVLHGFNPNVFYELAVAHCAGIPVIILSEKGIEPPFDIKDERVLHYDLGARPIYRGDNIRALVTMIESVRRLQGKLEVPFGDNLTPLGAAPTSLRNETNATAEYWGPIGPSRPQAAVSGRNRVHQLEEHPRDEGSADRHCGIRLRDPLAR